ncbi:MAG: ROK family protein [Bacteroidales bacterium]|nr:ROK family protein [Bacteroidales bacterium]
MKKIHNIVIGLDIGGTNTKFGLVAQEGKILAKSTVSTKGYENINQFIETLHNEINKLIKIFLLIIFRFNFTKF